MPTVRYTAGGRYRVAGHSFEHGDTASVSGGLADHLVDTGAFNVVNAGDRDDLVPADDYAGTHTVSEIREDIADIKNREWLATLRAAEAAGEHRTTALEAIDDRLAELED